MWYSFTVSLEYISYVDEQGNLTGETAEKLTAHNASTRKHLAFSIYLFDEDGIFLMTKRAKTKKVWPGVLTNSCCGHPAPGESTEDAIRRRCNYELGINQVTDIKCLLSDYSYITDPYNGIVENEFCPVFMGRIAKKSIKPNPDEVDQVIWLTWDEYRARIAAQPELFSFWTKEQTERIDASVRESI